MGTRRGARDIPPPRRGLSGVSVRGENPRLGRKQRSELPGSTPTTTIIFPHTGTPFPSSLPLHPRKGPVIQNANQRGSPRVQ